MAKGCIVLASAALESNLSHLSAVGLAFAIWCVRILIPPPRVTKRSLIFKVSGNTV